MKSNILLLATCDLGPLQFLLWGLIPFVLGFALGYLLWNHYKNRISELEDEIRNLKKRNNELDSNWKTSKTTYESEINNLKSSLADSNQMNVSKSDNVDSIRSAHAITLANKEKDHDSKIASLKSKIDQLNANIQSNKKSYEADLNALNNKNRDLEDKLKNQKTASASLTTTPDVKKSDDLKKIEGVGPKINELLNQAGINSFDDLAKAKKEYLHKIFEEAGPNYKLINPYSWPSQALLARDGKWDDLEEYQDYLIGGVDPAHIASGTKDEDLNLEEAKTIFGKTIKLNDLTLVEGIGPKIASILEDNDIKTWRGLANTKVDVLESILEKNSLQFHSPNTWPRQAALAASGNWKELLSWQDALDGGK